MMRVVENVSVAIVTVHCMPFSTAQSANAAKWPAVKLGRQKKWPTVISAIPVPASAGLPPDRQAPRCPRGVAQCDRKQTPECV